MIISNKINTTKLIINVVVLILTYFFSFHIFPKLNFYNQLEYKEIEINHKIFELVDLDLDFDINNNSKITSNLFFFDIFKISENSNKIKNKFLTEYLKYFNNNKNLISNAPCPKELMADNLRNIQIYNDYTIDYLKDGLKFNVRFSFYKFGSSEKLDINKCFDYIFKENLNKYFLLYRDKWIEKIKNPKNFFAAVNNEKSENSKEIKDLPFSTFLGEVEKGNIVSVDIKGNSIEGTFANGTKFRTYSPNYPNLVEKLSSKGVSFSAGPIEDKMPSFFMSNIKMENLIKLYQSINYLVDPNVSYTATQQKDKSSSQILTFIICLLIIVFINIIFNKLNKKQISKFVKMFIFK